jgi:hypothetical protein
LYIRTLAGLALAGMVGFTPCSFAQQISGGTPASEDGAPEQNYPGAVSPSQKQVARLQAEVQQLQAARARAAAQSQYSFSAEPTPNYDNSPIPNGDYGDWTGDYPGGPQD